MNHGNQYRSRKRELKKLLLWAREWIRMGRLDAAKAELRLWRFAMNHIPASTRRRWKCGR